MAGDPPIHYPFPPRQPCGCTCHDMPDLPCLSCGTNHMKIAALKARVTELEAALRNYWSADICTCPDMGGGKPGCFYCEARAALDTEDNSDDE